MNIVERYLKCVISIDNDYGLFIAVGIYKGEGIFKDTWIYSINHKDPEIVFLSDSAIAQIIGLEVLEYRLFLCRHSKCIYIDKEIYFISRFDAINGLHALIKMLNRRDFRRHPFKHLFALLFRRKKHEHNKKELS